MFRRLLRKIRFIRPQRAAVVIFDAEGSNILKRMILSDIEYSILNTREPLLFMRPKIILNLIRNLRFITLVLDPKISFSENLKKIRPQLVMGLYNIYFLSYLEYVRPKIVVTFIDNSYSFQWVSRVYKRAQFFAIQNGIRCRGDLKEWLPPYPQPGSIISMPNFFCFGRYETDLYTQYNHKIDNFHPVGSLKAGFYKKHIAQHDTHKKFDLCLVSQWHEHIIHGDSFPEIRRGLVRLDHYLNRYVEEKKVSFCVILRSNDKLEKEYFENKYGNNLTFIGPDFELLSSYAAIDQSRAVAAFDSTLAREAFGWGAKVLFCNFSEDNKYDFPKSGYWSLNEFIYDEFRNRLDYILRLDDVEYRKATKECAEYLMCHDADNPPHIRIRKLILEGLSRDV